MKKHLLFILLFFAVNAFSTKRNVPASYSSIQLALNACGVGDTVIVQPGTYAEHIVWPSVNWIKLFSVGDSSNTIIDATLNGRCITINPASAGILDSTVVIKGFKLTKGYSDTTLFNGVAIYTSYYAKVKLIDVVICRNKVSLQSYYPYNSYSGGICYFGANSILLNSSIYSNSVTCINTGLSGGLILGYGINYMNSTIYKNEITVVTNTYTAGQGLLINSGSMSNSLENIKITENIINFNCTLSTGGTGINGGMLFFGSYGGASVTNLKNILITNNFFNISSNMTIQGLVCYSWTYGAGATIIVHCTFADNTVIGNPTILTKTVHLHGYFSTSSTTCWSCTRSLIVRNSILWNPTINGNSEVAISNSSGSGGGITTMSVSNSNVNSYTTGVNCINQNPQFISSTDFHLQNTSPCINTGDLTFSIPTDLDGNPRPINIFPDMGCYEFNPITTNVSDDSMINSDHKIYPNPNNGIFILNSENREKTVIEIYNATGQLVSKKEIIESKSEIDISDQTNGFYFMRVFEKGVSSSIMKIIKQ